MIEHRFVGLVSEQLAGQAVAEADTVGGAFAARSASQHAAGVEDADVRDLLDRLDRLGQRFGNDADAFAQDFELDDRRTQLVAGFVEQRLAFGCGLAGFEYALGLDDRCVGLGGGERLDRIGLVERRLLFGFPIFLR